MSALSPQAAFEALKHVDGGTLALLDDTDRVVDFLGAGGSVRVSRLETVVRHLISQRFIESEPSRSTVTCLHGVIRKPVTPVRLTKAGKALLHRWSALTPLESK